MKPNRFIAKRLAYLGSLLALSFAANLAHAQFMVVARTIDLPPGLAAIRARQQEISEREHIPIAVADREYISGTLLDGLPDGLKDTVIKDTEDLPALAKRLLDYYGSLGEESLEVGRVLQREQIGEIKYQLIEYIAGLETEGTIEVVVDAETGELKRVHGWLHHDSGFDRVPLMSREDAIKRVVDALKRISPYAPTLTPVPTYEGNHKTRVVLLTWVDGLYDVIVPAWLVELDTSDVERDFQLVYFVTPDGRAVQAEHFIK